MMPKPSEEKDDTVSVSSDVHIPEFFRIPISRIPKHTLPERPALTLQSFRDKYQYIENPPDEYDVEDWKPLLTSKQTKDFITSRVPILTWGTSYNIRENLFADILSGITLGVLRIPQAMAYALLAKVDPVVGLHVCFYSCLVYVIFGTSRHISVGSFSVLCLMMGTIVNQHFPAQPSRADLYTEYASQVEDNVTETFTPDGVTPIQYLSAVCFVTGVIHIVMAVLQLGALSVLMSDVLVSGYLTGAAFHVFTSQVKLLFGLEVQVEERFFAVFHVYYQVLKQLDKANFVTLLVASIALVILVFTTNFDIFNFKKKTGIPLPTELTIIFIVTPLSYFLGFNKYYQVRIVGNIQSGFPAPSAPPWHVMPSVIVDCIPIAIVSFVVSLSMGIIFAKKHKYRVYATQELCALGLCNIFLSFFSCFPTSAALARTLVQEKAGCKTQIASVVSCGVIIAVLLFIGPLFEHLPICILGAIVMAAVQSMFFQVKDLILAWKMSPLNGMIWIVAFISVVIADVVYGLIVSVCFSLLTIILRTLHIEVFKIKLTEPQACLLGRLPGTDIYVDLNKYLMAEEIAGIKIFRFNGPLHFANRAYFKSRIQDLVNVTTKLTREARARRLTVHYLEKAERRTSLRSRPSIFFVNLVRFLILDCSGWPYIDASGLTTLHDLIADYEEESITVHLAACQDPVLYMLHHTNFETKATNSGIFPTIHDAVLYCTFARNALLH